MTVAWDFFFLLNSPHGGLGNHRFSFLLVTLKYYSLFIMHLVKFCAGCSPEGQRDRCKALLSGSLVRAPSAICSLLTE